MNTDNNSSVGAVQRRPPQRDLNPVEILAMCRQRTCPVGARVSAAKTAHRWAYDKDKTLAPFALRAMIFARTPKVQDYRDQLAYLAALPLDAWRDEWQAESGTPESVRAETLAIIERHLLHAMAPAVQS